MALAPAPHPRSVFRYLKTAYRRWIRGGSITLGAIANGTTATAVSATGTILPTMGVSNMTMNLNKGTVVASSLTVPVVKASGSFVANFGSLAAGTYQVNARNIGSPVGTVVPVLSNTFTIT